MEFLGNNILLVSDYSAHAMMPAGMTRYHPHCDMCETIACSAAVKIRLLPPELPSSSTYYSEEEDRLDT